MHLPIGASMLRRFQQSKLSNLVLPGAHLLVPKTKINAIAAQRQCWISPFFPAYATSGASVHYLIEIKENTFIFCLFHFSKLFYMLYKCKIRDNISINLSTYFNYFIISSSLSATNPDRQNVRCTYVSCEYSLYSLPRMRKKIVHIRISLVVRLLALLNETNFKPCIRHT